MSEHDGPPRLAKALGQVILMTRWLLVPIYLGLLVDLFVLAVKFVQEVVTLVPGARALTRSDAVLGVVGLVDLSLIANLVLVVILGGWQAFLDPLMGGDPGEQQRRFTLRFSEIKLRVIGSIAAIGSVELLESFLHPDAIVPGTIIWQLAILLSIGVLGVLLALMDRLSHH